MAKNLTVPELNIEVENLKANEIACRTRMNNSLETIGGRLRKIDDLTPLVALVDLIPLLQEMAKNQEAMQRTARWISKTTAWLAALLGGLYVVYKLVRGL